MSSFNAKDIADLEQAAHLVDGVMQRHPLEMALPLVGLFINAMNDIRKAEKYIGATSGVEL